MGCPQIKGSRVEGSKEDRRVVEGSKGEGAGEGAACVGKGAACVGVRAGVSAGVSAGEGAGVSAGVRVKKIVTTVRRRWTAATTKMMMRGKEMRTKKLNRARRM
jgi:hypothetical protein